MFFQSINILIFLSSEDTFDSSENIPIRDIFYTQNGFIKNNERSVRDRDLIDSPHIGLVAYRPLLKNKTNHQNSHNFISRSDCRSSYKQRNNQMRVVLEKFGLNEIMGV